jgi:hypothetical protein
MQQRSKSGFIRDWLSATVGIALTDRATARYYFLNLTALIVAEKAQDNC